MKPFRGFHVSQEELAGLEVSSENAGLRTSGRIKKPKVPFDPSDTLVTGKNRAAKQQETKENNTSSRESTGTLGCKNGTDNQRLQQSVGKQNSSANRTSQQTDDIIEISDESESDVDSTIPGRTANSASINGNTLEIRYHPFEPIDVPYIKGWTVDQVTEYFHQYFPEQAHFFKVNEVDGDTLLVLSRKDLYKMFPIKLGIVLRIYSLILKLQMGLDNPILGWFIT